MDGQLIFQIIVVSVPLLVALLMLIDSHVCTVPGWVGSALICCAASAALASLFWLR